MTDKWGAVPLLVSLGFVGLPPFLPDWAGLQGAAARFPG